MSNLRPFAIFPTVLFCDKELTGCDLRVYGIIASCQNKQKKAWPALDTIAKHIGTSKSAVCRSAKKLTERGYIAKIKQGGGIKNSNHYMINRDPQLVITGDNEQIDLEEAIAAKNFEQEVIAGDNSRLSPARPKDKQEDKDSILPCLRGVGTGDADASTPSGSLCSPGGSLADDADASTGGLAPSSMTAAIAAELSSMTSTKKDFAQSNTENSSTLYARKALAEYFGDWSAVIAADDPDCDQHDMAVRACTMAADVLKIHWQPPRKGA